MNAPKRRQTRHVIGSYLLVAVLLPAAAALAQPSEKSCQSSFTRCTLRCGASVSDLVCNSDTRTCNAYCPPGAQSIEDRIILTLIWSDPEPPDNSDRMLELFDKWRGAASELLRFIRSEGFDGESALLIAVFNTSEGLLVEARIGFVQITDSVGLTLVSDITAGDLSRLRENGDLDALLLQAFNSIQASVPR